MSATKPERATHHVQSLERGLAVIKVFDDVHPELTLTDVAERAGLTRAAARRFLLTLTDLGYAERDGRDFRLTPRILELGYSYLSSLSLPEIAQPHLDRLVAEVNESSSVSVLDEDHVVYVARAASSRRIMTVRINVGTRFPAAATSMGRVLLASLPDDQLEERLAQLELVSWTDHTTTSKDELRDILLEIRETGYVVLDQEFEEGLRSVAVPVHDSQRKVVAAANISTQASRRGVGDIVKTLLPPLQETVERIEQDLHLTVRAPRAGSDMRG